jgi:hypothetical protein
MFQNVKKIQFLGLFLSLVVNLQMAPNVWQAGAVAFLKHKTVCSHKCYFKGTKLF